MEKGKFYNKGKTVTMIKKLKEKANTNPLIKNCYNNRFSWLALACTVFIMMVVYYCYNLFPFGDTTILRMDLYHQYGPLFAELYERITNPDSLIYSWTSGGGSPFLGNFFNYLSSPTVLIMLLLGHKNMPEAIAGMILVKAAVASFTFSYFLSKKHKIQSPTVSAFGVLYACSGYFIAYYWNIMWLDAFYIFPLVILGIEKLISERKPKLYIITLALTIITNYYMGYMVCIFSVFYFIYYYFCNYEYNEKYFPNIQKRQKGIKNFFSWGYNFLRNSKFFDSGFRFAFCSIGAALLSAFALLPIYYILMNCSATSGTWPEEFKTYFSIFDFLANHLASLDPTIRSSGEDVLPNVYCGVLTVMLVPLYIFSNKITLKEKVFSIGFLGVMFASFYTNYLNYIWHGFHFPNDLPYRFSFMYSFLLLMFAFKAILNIKEYTSRQIIGVGVATTFFVILVQEIGSKNFTETGVWICVAFIGIYCLALGILKNDRYPAIAAAALILCSVCAEYTVANTNNYSMNQTKESFAGDYDDFQDIKNQIDEYNGDNNYRMELTSLRARMDPCWYYYNGMSTFTSMAYEKVANMQSDLGMFSNYINSYTYNRQTPVYNAFFALDYIVDNQQGSKADMNPTYYNRLFSAGKYTAYENLYQLPVAFRVNEEIIEWAPDNSNPFEIQSELFGNSTGHHNVFSDMKVTDVSGFAANCTDLSLSDDGYFPYSVEESIGAALTFTIQAEKSGNAYVYFKTAANSIDTITFTLSDGTVISQSVDTKPYIMDLGYLEKGETVQLYAPVEKGENGTIYLYAVTFNDGVFAKGYKQLKADSLQVTEFKETEINGTVNVSKDGILYTSINYDTGWSVYIDGEKVSRDNIVSIGNGALLGVNITEGEHEITFKYTQNGLVIGTCISILTLIIFILLSFIVKTGMFEFNPPLEEEDNDENGLVISDEEMEEIVQTVIENKRVTNTETEADTNE